MYVYVCVQLEDYDTDTDYTTQNNVCTRVTGEKHPPYSERHSIQGAVVGDGMRDGAGQPQELLAAPTNLPTPPHTCGCSVI